MRARFVVVALVALAALALGWSCTDSDTTPPPTDSGIEGLVTIGPICPVEREDSPCPDEPYQATIVIENADGDQVSSVTSGADGRFRVPLEPGTYTLVPQSPESRLPYASEQQVEVQAGAYTQVTIAYDSGIR